MTKEGELIRMKTAVINGKEQEIQVLSPVDSDVHFQKYQFDEDLRRAGSPIGTSHLQNQGSDVRTSTDIGTPQEENE